MLLKTVAGVAKIAATAGSSRHTKRGSAGIMLALTSYSVADLIWKNINAGTPCFFLKEQKAPAFQ